MPGTCRFGRASHTVTVIAPTDADADAVTPAELVTAFVPVFTWESVSVRDPVVPEQQPFPR
jgi:hypothetical protein